MVSKDLKEDKTNNDEDV